MQFHVNQVIKFVAPTDWRCTRKGHREQHMQIKAVIFRETWDIIKDLSLKNRTTVFLKMIDDGVKTELEKNAVPDINNAMAMEMLETLYQKDSRVSMLKYIETYLVNKDDKDGGSRNKAYDLRFAEEKDIYDAVLQYVVENDKITSASYVKSIIYEVHAAFFAMGRECDWGDKGYIKLAGEYNSPVMNSGNPMTSGSRDTIKKKFKDEISEGRRGKNDIQDEDGKTMHIHKHARPSSLAIVFYVMTNVFANILTNLSEPTVKVMKETENWVNVLMLYMFLIHEGGRPGDALGWHTNSSKVDHNKAAKKGQHHKNMMFSLNGKKYPLLVLSFLKPNHLATLMNTGAIKRYVCEFWKGKQVGKDGKGEYRARVKSCMPVAYNVLDLATMYVVLMRIKLCIAPHNVSTHVFKKGQNISDDMKKNTQPMRGEVREKRYFSVNVTGLKPYSIRYAAAEEERKAGISMLHTRYRMGHSFTSETAIQYSENLMQRVMLGGAEDVSLKLGWELHKEMDLKELPLLFSKHNVTSVFPDNIVADIDADIVAEMDAINVALDDIIAGKVMLSDVPSLMLRIPKTKKDLCSELKELPMGSHFKFEQGLLPDTTENELTTRLSHIHKYFAEVESPEAPQKLWMYPQVMWGEWNPELKPEVYALHDHNVNLFKSIIDQQLGELADVRTPSLPFKQPDNPPANPPENPPAATPMKRKRKPTARGEAMVESLAPKKRQMAPKADVWKGRVLAIIVPEQGKEPEYEFKVPGTNHSVWMGLVLRKANARGCMRFTMQLYKGTSLQDLVLSQTVEDIHAGTEGRVHHWDVQGTDSKTFKVAPRELVLMAKHINENFLPA